MAPAATGTLPLHAVPFDPRFPNVNQTKHCYQSYLDFHRCEKVKGKGNKVCQYFKHAYGDLCPNAWAAKWDEQREAGTFAGKI